jgi:hypothetical protein
MAQVGGPKAHRSGPKAHRGGPKPNQTPPEGLELYRLIHAEFKAFKALHGALMNSIDVYWHADVKNE